MHQTSFYARNYILWFSRADNIFISHFINSAFIFISFAFFPGLTLSGTGQVLIFLNKPATFSAGLSFPGKVSLSPPKTQSLYLPLSFELWLLYPSGSRTPPPGGKEKSLPSTSGLSTSVSARYSDPSERILITWPPSGCFFYLQFLSDIVLWPGQW